MTIIGTGDIASAIIDRPDRLYFAAGVSNSGETRPSEYRREFDLLLDQPSTAHLVYFSSLSTLSANGIYQQHKRYMESMVQRNFQLHAIIRIGNITWGKNKHTLINHLRARYAAGLPLEVQDVYRYVTDVDNFRGWLDRIPSDQSVEFNVIGRRLTVAQIVQEFVYGEKVAA